MFDQFNGMPMHVLLVHAAVVFVPLLALAAVVYALVPRLRARVGWVAALLALGAPVAALFAKLSGEAFKERLVADGMPASALGPINTHQEYGDLTFFSALALGIVTGVMLYLGDRAAKGRGLPRVADLGVAALVVVLAGVAGYFVFMTGDTGATAVWGTS